MLDTVKCINMFSSESPALSFIKANRIEGRDKHWGIQKASFILNTNSCKRRMKGAMAWCTCTEYGIGLKQSNG
jgi:hypothetical protein